MEPTIIILTFSIALIALLFINKPSTKNIPQEYIEQKTVQEGYTTIPTHLLPDPDKLDLLAQIFEQEDKILKDLTGQDRLTEVQDDLRTWATSIRTFAEN